RSRCRTAGLTSEIGQSRRRRRGRQRKPRPRLSCRDDNSPGEEGPMRILIEGGTVVTMNDRDEVLSPGFIDVRDGAIATVSSTTFTEAAADRRIDARGKVVMPGLVNAHTHLFQTFIRGVYEHLPFTEWLRRIYHCGRGLTAEDCRLSATLGCLESLKGGVTTVMDHHFLNRGLELPEATLAGMRAVGVRAVLARTVMDMGTL